MRALRLAAAKPLPSLLLRRSFAPALAQRAATSVAAPDTSGRTPERTAELERLAAEHNGFLFGEVVRLPARAQEACTSARACLRPRRRRCGFHILHSRPSCSVLTRPPAVLYCLCAAPGRGTEPRMGGLGVLIRADDGVGVRPLRAGVRVSVRHTMPSHPAAPTVPAPQHLICRCRVRVRVRPARTRT